MIPYLDRGEGNVLVLLHGFGCKKESWVHQYHLAEKYRLIIPDLFTKINFHPTRTIRSIAQNVISLLERLEIKEAYFCGVSYGGVILQEILFLRPDIVKSFILSNTISHISSLTHSLLLKDKVSFISRPDWFTYFISTCVSSHHEFSPLELQSFFHDDKELFLFFYQTLSNVSYMLELSKTEIPSLVIGTANDYFLPKYVFEQTYLLKPNSKYLFLHRGGHFLPWNEPKIFNQTILSFLEEVEHKSILSI